MIRNSYIYTIFISIVFIIICVLLRPILPLDETRYLSVSWDMWLNKNYIVPTLNGELYHHKPPLLFWLINLLWNIIGVNELFTRFVAPFFSLGVIINLYFICILLWPKNKSIRSIAPFVLMSSLLWLICSTVTMFDVMLTFFFTLSLVGILYFKNSFNDNFFIYKFFIGVLIYGFSMGVGILTKGPIILVFSIPVFLFCFIWDNSDYKYTLKFVIYWYLGFICSLTICLFISLSWALTASKLGGDEFKNAILWGQSANRVISGMSHARDWWWYLSIFPIIFFPWVFMPIVWNKFFKKCIYLNQGFKFCLFILIFSIIILSIFADKQPHYLTPLMPIVGLIFSYIFSTSLNININKINFIPIYLTLIFYFIFSYLLLFNQEILGINQNLKTPEIILLLIVPIISLIFSIFILFYKKNLLSNFIYIMTFQSIFLIFFIHIIFNIFLYNFYDLKGFSIKIDNLNNSNFKVAYVGKYHGQFNFLGRLEKPISVIEGGNVKEWFNINPNSYIVYNHRNMPNNEDIKPYYSQKFRGRTLSIWQKDQVINQLGIFTK